MSKPDDVIGIGVELDLAGLRKDLASIPGLTADQAKLMVSELAKAQKAAEKAAKASVAATAAAAKKAGEEGKNAADDLRGAADDVGDSTQQLSKGVGLISETAAGALQTVGDLSDGIKGIATAAQASGISLRAVGAAVGLATIAIAAAAYAYHQAQKEVDDINALRKEEAAIAASLVPAYRALEDAQDKLAIATGALSAADGAALGIRRAGQRAILDYAAAQKDARREAYESVIANETWLASIKTLVTGLVVLGDATSIIATTARAYAQGVSVGEIMDQDAASALASIEAMTGFQAAVDDARAALDRMDAAVGQQAGMQEQVVDATLAADKATRGKAAADKAAGEAAKLHADELKKLQDLMRSWGDIYTGSLSALDALTAAQRGSMATESERIELAHQSALATIFAEQEKLAAVTASGESTVAARQAVADATLAVEENYQTQVAKLQADATKKHTEELEKRRTDIQKIAVDSLASLASASATWADISAGMVGALQKRLEENGDHMTDAEKKQIKAQIEERKKGALIAFRISQQTAAAEAGVKAGLAALDAFQSAMAVVPYPANLIVAPVSAGIVALAGAAQVAQIEAQAPPTFHTGMAPDEYQAKLRQGEGVVTGQGVRTMGGPEAVRDVNAGRGAPGQPMQIYMSLDGRTVETALYASRKRGGVLSKTGTNRAGKSAIFRGI